jgi:hypothetical protein
MQSRSSPSAFQERSDLPEAGDWVAVSTEAMKVVAAARKTIAQSKALIAEAEVILSCIGPKKS